MFDQTLEQKCLDIFLDQLVQSLYYIQYIWILSCEFFLPVCPIKLEHAHILSPSFGWNISDVRPLFQTLKLLYQQQ